MANAPLRISNHTFEVEGRPNLVGQGYNQLREFITESDRNVHFAARNSGANAPESSDPSSNLQGRISAYQILYGRNGVHLTNSLIQPVGHSFYLLYEFMILPKNINEVVVEDLTLTSLPGLEFGVPDRIFAGGYSSKKSARTFRRKQAVMGLNDTLRTVRQGTPDDTIILDLVLKYCDTMVSQARLISGFNLLATMSLPYFIILEGSADPRSQKGDSILLRHAKNAFCYTKKQALLLNNLNSGSTPAAGVSDPTSEIRSTIINDIEASNATDPYFHDANVIEVIPHMKHYLFENKVINATGLGGFVGENITIPPPAIVRTAKDPETVTKQWTKLLGSPTTPGGPSGIDPKVVNEMRILTSPGESRPTIIAPYNNALVKNQGELNNIYTTYVPLPRLSAADTDIIIDCVTPYGERFSLSWSRDKSNHWYDDFDKKWTGYPDKSLVVGTIQNGRLQQKVVKVDKLDSTDIMICIAVTRINRGLNVYIAAQGCIKHLSGLTTGFRDKQMFDLSAAMYYEFVDFVLDSTQMYHIPSAFLTTLPVRADADDVTNGSISIAFCYSPGLKSKGYKEKLALFSTLPIIAQPLTLANTENRANPTLSLDMQSQPTMWAKHTNVSLIVPHIKDTGRLLELLRSETESVFPKNYRVGSANPIYSPVCGFTADGSNITESCLYGVRHPITHYDEFVPPYMFCGNTTTKRADKEGTDSIVCKTQDEGPLGTFANLSINALDYCIISTVKDGTIPLVGGISGEIQFHPINTALKSRGLDVDPLFFRDVFSHAKGEAGPSILQRETSVNALTL